VTCASLFLSRVAVQRGATAGGGRASALHPAPEGRFPSSLPPLFHAAQPMRASFARRCQSTVPNGIFALRHAVRLHRWRGEAGADLSRLQHNCFYGDSQGTSAPVVSGEIA